MQSIVPKKVICIFLQMLSTFSNSLKFKVVTSSIVFPSYLMGTTVGSRLCVGYNYIG